MHPMQPIIDDFRSYLERLTVIHDIMRKSLGYDEKTPSPPPSIAPKSTPNSDIIRIKPKPKPMKKSTTIPLDKKVIEQIILDVDPPKKKKTPKN
jgi:hypothetical protein